MNCYGYQEELKNLLELVKFKQYRRYGDVLYAKYEVVKPDCTILELVWGWCRNPVFAGRLAADLDSKIPNCEDFSKVLAKSNRLVQRSNIFETFDQAMKQICNKTKPSLMAFSTEGTNIFDESDQFYQAFNATDDDGEMWHGLLIENEDSWRKVSDVSISIVQGDDKNIIWERDFTASEVLQKTKRVNDVVVFNPFRHPLLLLNLEIAIETIVNYYDDNVNRTPVKQIFGIGSNDFCNWLSDACFETKMCDGFSALVDIQESNIVIKTSSS